MSHDLRKYAAQTNRRLFVGFVLLLFLVGGGLIYWLFGREAALMGLLCATLGLAPLLLVWLLLSGLGWLARRLDDQDEQEPPAR